MTNRTKHTRSALAQLHSIDERRFKGDYGACDTLIDLEKAIMRADLTGKQAEAVRLIFVEDKTQSEAGALLGVSQQAIAKHVETALQKIAEADAYGGD